MYATETPHSPSVLTRLNREWEHRYVDLQLDLGSAGQWAGGELLAHIHTVSGAAQDALLTSLLIAAQGGDRRVERVLLQVLLPTAIRVAMRTPALDDLELGDRIGCAVSAVWEAIRTHPTDRPTWVILHLTRIAHATLAGGSTAGQSEWERAVVALPDDALARVAGAAPAPVHPPEVLLRHLLADAVRGRVIGADDADFLLRCTSSEGGTAHVAADTGVTVAAVRKRRERLRRRLSAAYADQAGMVIERRPA
jgi:hypothetical protein